MRKACYSQPENVRILETLPCWKGSNPGDGGGRSMQMQQLSATRTKTWQVGYRYNAQRGRSLARVGVLNETFGKLILPASPHRFEGATHHFRQVSSTAPLRCSYSQHFIRNDESCANVVDDNLPCTRSVSQDFPNTSRY